MSVTAICVVYGVRGFLTSADFTVHVFCEIPPLAKVPAELTFSSFSDVVHITETISAAFDLLCGNKESKYIYWAVRTEQKPSKKEGGTVHVLGHC